MGEKECGQVRCSAENERVASLHPVQSPTSWPVRTLPHYDVMVAGAGLAGAALARLFADRAGFTVLAVDPRRTLDELGDGRNVPAAPPSLARRLPAARRRRAAAYLARFSRCGSCQQIGVPCIHSTEADRWVIERLLDHPRIELLLGVDPAAARQAYGHRLLVHAEPMGASREETVAQAIAAFERAVAGQPGDARIASAA
jgi:choline dehydrogenase-like flavoprotein